MLRRWSLVIGLSLVIHAVLVGGGIGVALLLGLPFGRLVDVQITGMSLEEIHDLPLGPPPGGAPPPPEPAGRPQGPKVPDDGTGALTTGNEDKPRRSKGEAPKGPAAAEPAPKASDLRQYGPEGSRVTALVRLDRLRATPYGPAVDELLSRLPDRHDLLDGTGLDMYKDFDALLIATPNPLDYTVTFLAVRHHLGDAKLKAALDRGAKATNRVLTWRTEARRPVAERRPRDPGDGPSRDQRIVALVAPGLAVVTPPVYRSMLLRPPGPRATPGPDGGAGGAAGDGGGTAAAGSPTDVERFDADGWRALLKRIDAQDSILPANAIAMLNAVDIFSARSLRRGLDTVPSGGKLSRGVAGAGTSTARIYGMEVPRMLTAVLGADPSPFADVKAQFQDEEEAAHWEREWPALRNKLAVNPYLVLSGFVSLLNRLELTRDGSLVHLHLTASELETTRLLQLLARFAVR